MQHRLISGKSCNVEEQERVFSTITNITKSTSSYHPSHIIGNVFVRLQAEKQMQAFQSSCVSKQQASVSKLAASLRPYGNTIIAHRIAEKHSRSWQAHLERISDFLLIGKGNCCIEHKMVMLNFMMVNSPQMFILKVLLSIIFVLVILMMKRSIFKNAGRSAYVLVWCCQQKYYGLKMIKET